MIIALTIAHSNEAPKIPWFVFSYRYLPLIGARVKALSGIKNQNPNLAKPKPNRMLSCDFIYPGFGLSKLSDSADEGESAYTRVGSCL